MVNVLPCLGALVAIVLLGTIFRANFYSWEISYYIQIDPRYQHDPEWRRAADRALWRHKEAVFARREGLISTKPHWVERARLIVFCCIAIEWMLFG